MVGFRNLVGVGIAPVSKKNAVKYQGKSSDGCFFSSSLIVFFANKLLTEFDNKFQIHYMNHKIPIH